jgi:uncharacterized surface protein with fasciclin (FAS1) repeats
MEGPNTTRESQIGEKTMKTTHVLVAAVMAIGLVGCNSSSPVAPTSAMESHGGAAEVRRPGLPSIVEIAVGNPDFSTLVAAVVKADLVDLLNGNPNYTVFAPTNAAFDTLAGALGAANGPALIEAVDVETLTAILSYHVTRGDRNSTSVVSAGSLRMLDGNFAQVSVRSDGAYIENAKIVATDIRARNGIVHVIDGVILPPSMR